MCIENFELIFYISAYGDSYNGNGEGGGYGTEGNLIGGYGNEYENSYNGGIELIQGYFKWR